MQKAYFQILANSTQKKKNWCTRRVNGLLSYRWCCFIHHANQGGFLGRHFIIMLDSVLRFQGVLLKNPEPILEDSTNDRWKWFKVQHNWSIF